MPKVATRLLLISTLAIVVVGFISYMAYKAENFWVNFSLNLLTEIIGAILIAVYLKINMTKGFSDLSKEIRAQIDAQRDAQRIKRAFESSDPESAWDLLLEFKKRQLETKEAELATIGADEKRRNLIIAEIELLKEYIAVADSIANRGSGRN